VDTTEAKTHVKEHILDLFDYDNTSCYEKADSFIVEVQTNTQLQEALLALIGNNDAVNCVVGK
jgi:hypothetical protein